METFIKKETILVCIRQQSTGCGIKYLKKGSIVKCAEDCPSWRDTVEVFRNEEAIDRKKWHPVDRKKLRLATPVETQMYYEGKYFLEEVEAE